MTFTPKDWKDSPDETTPITAAALEDLETRLAAYADSVSGGDTLVYDSGLLAAQTADLTVSGLDGNTDQAWEITAAGRVASVAAGAGAILVHPNGNTTADKRRTRQIVITNSGGSTAAETNDTTLLSGLQLVSTLTLTASYAVASKGTLQARAGGVTNGRRVWLFQYIAAADLTTAEMATGQGGGFWPNDTDNITSLVFSFGAAFTGRIVIRRVGELVA